MIRVQTLLALRDEPPNVGALARRVGLERDQLERAFCASTGSTVPQWWKQHHPDPREYTPQHARTPSGRR